MVVVVKKFICLSVSLSTLVLCFASCGTDEDKSKQLKVAIQETIKTNIEAKSANYEDTFGYVKPDDVYMLIEEVYSYKDETDVLHNTGGFEEGKNTAAYDSLIQKRDVFYSKYERVDSEKRIYNDYLFVGTDYMHNSTLENYQGIVTLSEAKKIVSNYQNNLCDLTRE